MNSFITVTLAPAGDLERIGPHWRALEARADASFFQRWSWVGCDAARRMRDPLLLEARCGDQTVGLGLLSRRRGWLRETLWLTETGDRRLDGVFVEHNGPLIHRDWPPALTACLAALLRAPVAGGRPPRGRRVVLSGVPDEVLHAARAAGARVRVVGSRAAPYVDLRSVPAGPDGYVQSLSANTRYQLRRAARRYAAFGTPRVARAGCVREALAFLEALAALHQASWNRRGRPGAFADPDFQRFHRALIERAMPRGEVDLLHVTAGSTTIGYLYNFLCLPSVLAYQSGFADGGDDPHLKPGMICHQLAIDMYRLEHFREYDFLAGDDRYKRSLGNASRAMWWLHVTPAESPRAVLIDTAGAVARAARSAAGAIIRQARGQWTRLPLVLSRRG